MIRFRILSLFSFQDIELACTNNTRFKAKEEKSIVGAYLMSVIMKFIANNPPSILFLGVILVYLLGETDFAYTLLVAGIFLQVLWLFFFRRR